MNNEYYKDGMDWKTFFESKIREDEVFQSPDFLVKNIPHNTSYIVSLNGEINIKHSRDHFDIDFGKFKRKKNYGDVLSLEYEDKNQYGSKQYITIEYENGKIEEIECGFRDSFNLYFDSYYTYILSNYLLIKKIQNNFKKISYSTHSVKRTYFEVQKPVYNKLHIDENNFYSKDVSTTRYARFLNVKLIDLNKAYYFDARKYIKAGNSDFLVSSDKKLKDNINSFISLYDNIKKLLDNYSMKNEIELRKIDYCDHILDNFSFKDMKANGKIYNVGVTDFQGDISELEVYLKTKIKNEKKPFNNFKIDKINDIGGFDNTNFNLSRIPVLDKSIKKLLSNLREFYLYKDEINKLFDVFKISYKYNLKTNLYVKTFDSKFDKTETVNPTVNIIVTTKKEIVELKEVNIFTFTECLIKESNAALPRFDINTNNAEYIKNIMDGKIGGLSKIIKDVKVEQLPALFEMKGTYNDLYLIGEYFKDFNLKITDGNEIYNRELNYFINTIPSDFDTNIDEFLLNKNTYEKFGNDIQIFAKLDATKSSYVFNNDVIVGDRTYLKDASGLYFVNEYDVDLHKINFNMDIKYFDSVFVRKFKIFHDVTNLKNKYEEATKYFNDSDEVSLQIDNSPANKIVNSTYINIPGSEYKFSDNKLVVDEFDDCYVMIKSAVDLDDLKITFNETLNVIKNVLVEQMPYFLKYNWEEFKLSIADYYITNGENRKLIKGNSSKHIVYEDDLYINLGEKDTYNINKYISDNASTETDISSIDTFDIDKNIYETFNIEISKVYKPFKISSTSNFIKDKRYKDFYSSREVKDKDEVLLDFFNSYETTTQLLYNEASNDEGTIMPLPKPTEKMWIGGNIIYEKVGGLQFKGYIDGKSGDIHSKGSSIFCTDSYTNIMIGKDTLTLDGKYMQEVRVRKFRYRDIEDKLNNDLVFGIKITENKTEKSFFFTPKGIVYIRYSQGVNNENFYSEIKKIKDRFNRGTLTDFDKENKVNFQKFKNYKFGISRDYIFSKKGEDIYVGGGTIKYNNSIYVLDLADNECGGKADNEYVLRNFKEME